jgi:hypothetical protein
LLSIVGITQLHAGGRGFMSFRHRPLTDPEATEVEVLAEVIFDKMENEKLGKKRKKLSI